ncbi:MAG: 16S rRNA (adenine(1518)-N(6)/adenine(1519)-N(6))-dimethyltransferase RsmA [Thermoanaerobaculales bacterium]|nr:16S rRNA (adenine(1518)-N(6)/adenine(1519)-N(6))-dimethyltransferase RsmA [Thermoanaerobaculales bacterium]
MGRTKRRRLGQNFLVDRDVAARIVGVLADEPTRVLEIGPGRGALTEPLLERFERVLAFELDENLVQPLQQRFGGHRLEIRSADALRVDLDILQAESPWQVAANLPYSVGTAILRRLMPRHDLFTRLVVMLQREVAHRVVASPGGSGHGLLALERAAWGEARLLFDVPPRAFRPVPKVVSSVLVVDLRPPSFDPGAIASGLAVAAHALTKPRKMLSNSVAPLRDAAAIAGAGLDPCQRPGTVDLEGWILLAGQS